MEASALYAFAQAKMKAVVCFAHITNQMAQVEGDFEKGANNGNDSALEVIYLTAKACLPQISS
jgi:uridine phosphorylase